MLADGGGRVGRGRFEADGYFTQEDPIGIAGGLNLYGYAGGDPINFSDPFGLMADTIGTEVREQLGDMCDKIDCDQAEVVTEGVVHAGVMKISDGRPVTLGNKIYMNATPDPGDAFSMGVMAHELTHVGQYQQWGALAYYISAAADRFTELGGGNPYTWRGTAGEVSARWRRMEQWGRIVQDCFGGSSRACALSPYTFRPGGG